MKIRPLFDRIIVRRLDAEAKSPGGLILPRIAQEKPVRGEVLAVGEGKYEGDGTLRPLRVKRGDKVLFGRYSGGEVKLGEETVLAMREEDIIGIIEE